MKYICKHIIIICSYFSMLFGCSTLSGQVQFKVNEITFTGLKKTKASFLRRIAKVKKMQLTDSLKIKTDVERIKRLDGIAHATYTVKETNGAYKVTYDVRENFSLIPGARISEANDGNFSYRVSAFEFNGLGRNIIFGGFFKREVFNGFGVLLEHPYLFTNKLGLGLNYIDDTSQQPIYLSPDNPINYTYTRKGPEATLFYEHNFNNRFELGAKIFKEGYNIILDDPENKGIINPLEPSINNTLIRGSYEYIDIDIEFQYQSGFRNFLDTTYFIDKEGALQTEYIINNTTQYFRRLGTKGNLATQLQLQFSNPVDNTFFVPLTIDNQLNTRGAGNTIDRGTATITLNTEYRHTIYEKNWFVIQGNTFLDISGIQRPNQDYSSVFSSETLLVYPGLGIRFIHKYIFNTVLRFDYGINATGNGDNGLVFGIGQYF